jgi:competence protein ComEA
MAKTTWKDYFTFTKTERISVFILLFIIAVSAIGPFYYARKFNPPTIDSALQRQLDVVLQGNAVTDSGAAVANNEQPSSIIPVNTTLFYFDPNTLDAEGFKKLGLRDKTVQTLLNYRSKGGHFGKADDIRKIYGLRQDEADRLIPYIKIENAVSNKNDADFYEAEKERPKPIIKKIDINTATEEEWKALPGIGEVLSKRIVKFRNSIHGFKSVNDISKTYGLSDSTFQLILPYLIISESNQ